MLIFFNSIDCFVFLKRKSFNDQFIRIALDLPFPFSSSLACNYILLFLYYRDNADDFIAAHRLSDMLVKINLDESVSKNQGSTVGCPSIQMTSVHVQPTELGTG